MLNYRYFLIKNNGPELEVTKAEFVMAERAAGFRNTLGRPDEPATAGFSWHHHQSSIEGRVEIE